MAKKPTTSSLAKMEKEYRAHPERWHAAPLGEQLAMLRSLQRSDLGKPKRRTKAKRAPSRSTLKHET